MDQSRSESPFGIRQIARILLQFVSRRRIPVARAARVSEVAAAARIAGPDRREVESVHSWSCLLLAGCHGQGVAERRVAGSFQ